MESPPISMGLFRGHIRDRRDSLGRYFDSESVFGLRGSQWGGLQGWGSTVLVSLQEIFVQLAASIVPSGAGFRVS
jgi:hypothetical protein